MATIYGSGGNESLTGTTSADAVYGGNGSDTVAASDGNDLIVGDGPAGGTWNVRIYDRDFSSAANQADEIDLGTLRLQTTVDDFDLDTHVNQARGTTGNQEDFGAIYTSTFTADGGGVYRFTTTSDDGSWLRILEANGNPLSFVNDTGKDTTYLDNDFHQAPTARGGQVMLQSSQAYTIELRVWENLGGQVLSSTVTPPNPDGSAGSIPVDLIGSIYIGQPPQTGDAGDDNLSGAAGNDTIEGNEGNDSLYGGSDADFLSGGPGSDLLDGGTGDDMLRGGAGGDTLNGGTGMDFADYATSAEGVYLDLSDGTAFGGDAAGDVVQGAVEGIVGSAANDTLTGADGEATSGGDIHTTIIFGGGGDDYIDGRAGGDTLYGGTGADTIIAGAGNDLVQGGDDADRITGSAGDTVDGGEGGTDADTLVATGVYSVAFDPNNSESGTITFVDTSTLTFTNIENLILNGGNRDGLVTGTEAGQVMDVGYVDANGDRIDGEDATLPGDAPNDDGIFGLGGDDTITSGLGDDDVFGGEGNDEIRTGVGNDYALGDAGNDTLSGEDDDDFLRGDAGNDQVFGGSGNDTVFGGADDDVVDAGDGNDSAFGGFGRDTVYGGEGRDSITGSGHDDEVYGGDGDDYIQGSDGADTLYGGDGADTLLGEEDGDSLYAGSGDTVDGFETVTTGTDLDRLYVTEVASVTFDTGFPENGIVTFNDGGTLTFFNVEQVFVDGVRFINPDFVVEGTGGDDAIDSAYTGDPDGDRIDAGDSAAGNDDDVVQAGAGNDTVRAGAGDDLVQGEGDDDRLFGGAGADTLEGGAGADQLDGSDGADSLAGGDDADTLFGGAGDTIDGGDGGDDRDVLDLTAYGHSGTTIHYTDNDPDTGSGTVDFLDSNGDVAGSLTFTNIESVVPCFTPGCRILTEAGEVPVETVSVGDRVLTRDNGYQTVCWVARRNLSQADLRSSGPFNPVRIAKGALGDGLPMRDMVVSPQHRMLVAGPVPELLFGDPEVLVAATHLVGMQGVTRIFPRGVSYIHLLFDQHEIVRADGAWSESFQPGLQTVAGLGAAQREEVLALFPDLGAGQAYPAARMTLKAREALVLRRG